MSCTSDPHTATLTLAPQQGAFHPWFTQLKIVFYGAPSARSAALNTAALPAPQYDPSQHAATVLAPYSAAGESIVLRY